ncbi:MFS transporter [Paenibacillus chartarius]|uniref:MFS transporter n=1 Tax=Paenibacillus chartarius TaxID=747481 RepID=A0ABV6DES3_9BACL
MERYSWNRQFAALLAVQLLVSTAHGMFTPLLPGFLQESGAVSGGRLPIWSGLIFSSNFIAMMLAMPLLGRFGDRYGRKPVMLWSGFGMAVVTALMSLAHEPWLLTALRFVQGCFTGILPFAMVLVLIGAAERKVGVSAGTMQTMGETGSLLGPLAGSLLLTLLPAREAFPAMSLCIALAAVCVALFVKEAPLAQPADAAAKTSFKQDWVVLWRCKPLPSLLLSALCVNFSLVGMQPVLPYYVAESTYRFAWLSEEWQLGITLSVTSLAVILFSPLLGRAADRIGPLPLLKLSTAAAACLCAVQAFTHLYPIILACRFLLGLCIAGMMPNIQAQVRRLVQPGMESRTYAAVNSWMFFGSLAGPLLGGAITAWFGTSGWFAAAGLMFAISFWQALRIAASARAAGAASQEAGSAAASAASA